MKYFVGAFLRQDQDTNEYINQCKQTLSAAHQTNEYVHATSS